MSAQSIANRSHRSAAVDPNDPVAARALEFAAWARRNIRVILGAAVVAALLVSGVVYYFVRQTQREESAAAALMQLEQSVSSANPALAVKDLQKFVQTHRGTDAALEARIALAQMQLQQNKPAEAITALDGAAAQIGDSPVGPQAALLLAAAQQAAGKPKDAIETYLRVADDAPLAFQRSEALEAAAILRVQGNDLPGAIQLYERLVAGAEEGSQERQIYEMRLAELQAKAAAK